MSFAAVNSTSPLLINGRRRWLEPWALTAIVIAILAAIPVISVITIALAPRENIWPHLAATVLPIYLWNTIILLVGVGIAVLVTGVSAAWLVTLCRFPGKRWFEWLLLLPMAVPAYVIAYVYTDLLEYAGPVQSALRSVFGWQSAADYWFPSIRSMGGAILLMGVVLYPYVYLMARAAFLEQSVNTWEASRVLGHGPWRTFFKVSLPIARPSIAIGLALALVETLNDYGTVDFFAVRTLTTGIYDVWLKMNNVGGAAQIASVMLSFVILLIALERIGRRNKRFYQTGSSRYKQLPEFSLYGWRLWAALTVCAVPVIVGFVLPALLLMRYAIHYFHESWTTEFQTYALNSLFVSSLAAGCALTLALLAAYARRLRGGGGATALSTNIASLGYAVPGAVLAIGVIVPFAAADNAVDAFMREYIGVSTGLILSGTVFALVFAYVVRFMAVAVGAVDSSLDKITPSMDMAARSLGYTPGKTLWRFHLPLIRGGMLTAVLLVFVDCMKELPATLILRPFNFDTLATHVYQFASDELIEQAALGSLLIVLCGLLPVALLSRTISDSRKLPTF